MATGGTSPPPAQDNSCRTPPQHNQRNPECSRQLRPAGMPPRRLLPERGLVYLFIFLIIIIFFHLLLMTIRFVSSDEDGARTLARTPGEGGDGGSAGRTGGGFYALQPHSTEHPPGGATTGRGTGTTRTVLCLRPGSEGGAEPEPVLRKRWGCSPAPWPRALPVLGVWLPAWDVAAVGGAPMPPEGSEVSGGSCAPGKPFNEPQTRFVRGAPRHLAFLLGWSGGRGSGGGGCSLHGDMWAVPACLAGSQPHRGY